MRAEKADEAPDHGWRSAERGGIAETLQRRAQIAFRIDEKIGRRDNFLAGFDTVDHLDPVTACVPRRTGRGSKRPSPRSMQHHLTRAAVDDS